MPGGAVIMATADTNRIEAPITTKTYMMCAFAAFGGIFFGFDSGYINGVLDTRFAIHTFTGLPYSTPEADFIFSASQSAEIVSLLSFGTFFGALIAGDLADFFGRRTTVIAGCGVFLVGVIIQVASSTIPVLVVGRVIAGLGVGFVSAIIILYMSEIAPKKVRGAIVAGYQFCITIGILLASIVTYACEDRNDSGSYRIPMAIQLLWGLILGIGLFFLPESPRYFVKRGNLAQAAMALARVRNQPEDSEFVQAELAEIIANHEYELSVIPQGSYFQSWAHCFTGSVFNPSSNLRRTILGTALQCAQQWTGVNFIFYYGTKFFQTLGTISNAFLISLVTNLVNMVSTPVSFWTVERFGRRPLLIYGAAGMTVCLLVTAVLGVTYDLGGVTHASQVSGLIAFICIYIFFFASTWGPGAWIVIGEIFPLPIRSRGVALSTASNWLWNCIIAIITPYMVADLGPKIFFVFFGTCILCGVFAYFCVFETKGLSLEQVDRMMEESTPYNSSKWVPHSTFAADLGMTADGKLENSIIVDVERKGSVH